MSLVSKEWLQNNLPGSKIMKVGEILDPCSRIRAQWDKQSVIPFVGWADNKFELLSDSSDISDK